MNDNEVFNVDECGPYLNFFQPAANPAPAVTKVTMIT